MQSTWDLAFKVLMFRSDNMLENMLNWCEKIKFRDLMCCIAYDMIMKGDY